MSLLTTPVPRSLESKIRLFGMELGDLLLVFLYMAIANLFFGSTSLKFPIVWLGTAALAGGLFFFKKDKPDHYLEHLGEYLRTPDILSAGAEDTEYVPYQPFVRITGKEVAL